MRKTEDFSSQPPWTLNKRCCSITIVLKKIWTIQLPRSSTILYNSRINDFIGQIHGKKEGGSFWSKISFALKLNGTRKKVSFSERIVKLFSLRSSVLLTQLFILQVLDGQIRVWSCFFVTTPNDQFCDVIRVQMGLANASSVQNTAAILFFFSEGLVWIEEPRIESSLVQTSFYFYVDYLCIIFFKICSCSSFGEDIIFV